MRWTPPTRESDEGVFHVRADGYRVAMAYTMTDAKLIVRAVNSHDELLAACQWFMAQLDHGVLVRDISKDGDPDWPMRMLAFTRNLSGAAAAIAKATS